MFPTWSLIVIKVFWDNMINYQYFLLFLIHFLFIKYTSICKMAYFHFFNCCPSTKW